MKSIKNQQHSKIFLHCLQQLPYFPVLLFCFLTGFQSLCVNTRISNMKHLVNCGNISVNFWWNVFDLWKTCCGEKFVEKTSYGGISKLRAENLLLKLTAMIPNVIRCLNFIKKPNVLLIFGLSLLNIFRKQIYNE